jgi:hypothetical protein
MVAFPRRLLAAMRRLLRKVEAGTKFNEGRLAAKPGRDRVEEQLRPLDGLSSQEYYSEVARNRGDTGLRKLAVLKLEDEGLVRSIADSDRDRHVRQAAQHRLEEIIAARRLDCLTASSTDDLEAFTRIAGLVRAEPNPVSWKMGLARITDPATLFSIASTDPRYEVRRECVQRLNDQELIGKIALEDGDFHVRSAALDRLTDQSLLERAALFDANSSLRSKATSRITDQATLAKIAMAEGTHSVCLEALARLTDSEIIARIARTHEAGEVRLAALRQIQDFTLAHEIVKTDRDSDVRLGTLDMIEDQSLLIEIAENDRASRVRIAAFSRIIHQSSCKSAVFRLLQRGAIAIQCEGINIQYVKLSLVNNTNEELRVLIPVGTIFVSSGAHQSMSSAEPYEAVLDPHRSATLKVRVACINKLRPVPNPDSRFSRIEQSSGPLLEFLRVSTTEPPAVIQAGVWAITDGTLKAQLTPEMGFSRWHVDRAWTILRSIGYIR